MINYWTGLVLVYQRSAVRLLSLLFASDSRSAKSSESTHIAADTIMMNPNIRFSPFMAPPFRSRLAIGSSQKGAGPLFSMTTTQ